MSEIVAEGIVPADALQQFVDTFLPIVAEARIHFDDDGLHARAVDPGNVAMGDVGLSTDAFESYDAPGRVTIGAPLQAVDDRLAVADSGDLVRIAVDMETRKLQVEIRTIEQEVALIAPDTIRKEPSSVADDLGHPNEVTVEGAVLDEALTVADVVTDHVGVRGEPEDERVVVWGRGDDDYSEVAWGHDEVLDASVPEAVESLVSLDYATDLSKPIPDDAAVTVRFGDEFPIDFEWVAVEGALSVEQRLAPRIQSG